MMTCAEEEPRIKSSSILFLTEQFTYARFDVGESQVAGGSRYLAGRQAHRIAGGGSLGEPVVLEYPVFCGVDYCRYASVSPHRAV